MRNEIKILSTHIFTISLVLLLSYAKLYSQAKPHPISLKEYNTITSNKDSLVLVYFHASWCAVCSKTDPVVAAVEKEYASRVKVIRIDTDRDKEVAQEFEIDALPLLMLYKKGTRQWIFPGIIDANSLRAKIDVQLE